MECLRRDVFICEPWYEDGLDLGYAIRPRNDTNQLRAMGSSQDLCKL